MVYVWVRRSSIPIAIETQNEVPELYHVIECDNDHIRETIVALVF